MGNSIFNRNKKVHKTVLLGIDSAGKTTLMMNSQKQFKEEQPIIPTISTNEIETSIGNFHINCLDITSSIQFNRNARAIVSHYISPMDFVIYMLDANVLQVQAEHNNEYFNYLISNTNTDPNVPWLILLNKMDFDGAGTVDQVENLLGIDKLSEQRRSNIAVFGVNAKTGEGVQTAFKWVQEILKLKK